MKKLFVNLSLAAAAVMLTACAGNQSGRGANPEQPAETAAVSDVGATAAAASEAEPTPTPEPEPVMLARVECYPDEMASMEGGVVLPDTWTENYYTAEGLLAESLSGSMGGEADTRVKYSYDDQDFLVRADHECLENGAWQTDYTDVYENDAYGNVLTQTTQYADGSQWQLSYTYEYDENGRWTRRDQVNTGFPMWSTREYTGEGHACTEYLYYSGEKLRMVSTYDEAGNLLREQDIDNGEESGFREYTYDDQGELICVTADYPTDNLSVMDMWKYTNTYAPLSQVLADAE